MLVAAIVIASLLGGLGLWAVLRRRRDADQAVPAAKDSKATVAAAAVDNARVELANGLVTERLWRLAFAAPSQAQLPDSQDAEIREAVSAALEAEAMDPKHFPRRPTLMPQ